MTLAGFRASNHPQQTAKRGASDEVDDRGTDPAFVEQMQERFGVFTLDVAAAPHNAKASRFYTRADDGLSKSWGGSRVWCNPPYSDCGAWVRKAWAEWPNTDLIVMLLPANRVEQGWWQEHVEPFRDRPGSPLRVEFLRGRLATLADLHRCPLDGCPECGTGLNVAPAPASSGEVGRCLSCGFPEDCHGKSGEWCLGFTPRPVGWPRKFRPVDAAPESGEGR